MQEELESYEETMHSNRGSGRERVPTEFSEIGRIEGSMTELVGIGRNKVLLQSSAGSVVPRSYDTTHLLGLVATACDCNYVMEQLNIRYS